MNVLALPTSSASTHPVPAAPGSSSNERELIDRLRGGDERAFLDLVEKLHSGLIRVAMLYVRTHDVAEEVVQETWIAVLEGLHRFEGRSSLKTWISHIVANQARTRAVREARCLPFSSFDESVACELADRTPSVAPERFTSAGDGADSPLRGRWTEAPRDWRRGSAERALLDAETLRFVEVALDTLPPAQKIVVTLRDVEGWEAEDVCNALGLSETNQRVLLHRGRARVRAMLERHLGDDLPCPPPSRSDTRSARS